jgi:diguanylate cyclase (GGDEF)-like protein
VAVVGGTSLPQLAVLMSLIIAGISGASAFIMFGARPRFDLLRCIIGAPNLMVSVAFFWRAYVAFSGGRLTVFSSSPAQTMIYIGAYFLLTVNGFGFLLLCKQKDERSLRELATKDNLTGLVNRHAFLSRAEQAHALAKRLRQPLALLMIDIDHFKQLNDRYGHTSGDAALRAFAQAGQAGLRKNDLFGRLGGEEFAVLLPAADLGQAMDAAERLRLAVSAVSLDADGENHSITVSIGVAEVSNDEMVSAALARADKVLYVAKRNGRNRVEADVSIAAPFSANGVATAAMSTSVGS